MAIDPETTPAPEPMPEPWIGPLPPRHLAGGELRYPGPSAEVKSAAWTARQSPVRALANAVAHHALAHTTGDQTTNAQEKAFARVDTVVTGRAARRAYDAHPPTDDEIRAWVAKITPADPIAPAPLAKSIAAVRRRLQAVRDHLDAHPRAASGFEPPAGHGSRWIAVSAEADPPWRPVNVACTWRAQHDAEITCGVPLDVRYAIAGDLDEQPVVILLHGLGSRLEESDGVARHLAELGIASIAVDLPSHGCTTQVDPARIPQLLPIAEKIPFELTAQTSFPFLAYLDAFVQSFVEHVRAEHELDDRIVCVAGGSLGGNLALRRVTRGIGLARGPAVFAWSPGSVWGSYFEHASDFVRLEAVRMTFAGAEARDLAGHGPHDADRADPRHEYFHLSFEHAIQIGTHLLKPPGSYYWWNPSMPKPLLRKHIEAAIRDRLELYSETFRRWQHRLAYEQLIFSYHGPVCRYPDLGAGVHAQTRIGLAAGSGDDFEGTHVFRNVRLMHDRIDPHARVTAHLWNDTGHSIHDERPRALARALARFAEVA